MVYLKLRYQGICSKSFSGTCIYNYVSYFVPTLPCLRKQQTFNTLFFQQPSENSMPKSVSNVNRSRLSKQLVACQL